MGNCFWDNWRVKVKYFKYFIFLPVILYIYGLSQSQLIFNPEDEDTTLFRNVDFYQPVHTAT